MLLLFVSALLSATLNLSNAQETITIKRGEIFANVISPGYPQAYSEISAKPLTWKFQADEDVQLKLQCDDFRLSETDSCTSVNFRVDDGTNKKDNCGAIDTFQYISTSNWLTITLEGDDYGEAVFSCFVKRMDSLTPKEIQLTLNTPYHLKVPEEVNPFFDQSWNFKAAEDMQVKLNCYINLLKMSPCFEEILTIDLGGNKPQKLCGFENKKFFSEKNEVTLRLELGINGVGKVHCIAEAVTKTDDSASQSRGIDFDEEDSSEHGVLPGTKKTTCLCGWANKKRSRIIHGKEASPNEYPWMVALKAYFDEAYATCGGSIITSRHVVTAAHCLVNMYDDMRPVKPQDLLVTVGAHDIDKRTPKGTIVEYVASAIFIRPEFIKQYTHDIGVIVLKEKIDFSQTVGPICMSPTKISQPKQKLTIIGWGKTENGAGSSVLLKAKTSVIDRKKCNINEFEVCTRADQSATCTGDSGGPLSWLDPETNRYTLVSLVSYGDPDCVSSPSVSTELSYFWDWIHEIIKKTYPDEMTCNKVQ